MKKLFLSSALPVLFLFSSCDKVNDPIVKKTVTNPTSNSYVSNDNLDVAANKKTLLEDYTGQACTNCPDAAAEATNLLTNNPGKLVVIAVHGGDFADPTSTYTNDFRTTAGKAWLPYFGIATWPIGIINRKAYSGTAVYSVRTKWAAAVALANAEPMVVKLEVSTQYDTIGRVLNTKVKGFFNAARSSNLSVTAVLTEDGIRGKQLNHGVIQDNYLFDHLVRGTISDTHVWGLRLKTAPVVANSDTTLSMPSFLVNSKYDAHELSVVVFVSDETTRQVLQVEKVKIWKKD